MTISTTHLKLSASHWESLFLFFREQPDSCSKSEFFRRALNFGYALQHVQTAYNTTPHLHHNDDWKSRALRRHCVKVGEIEEIFLGFEQTVTEIRACFKLIVKTVLSRAEVEHFVAPIIINFGVFSSWVRNWLVLKFSPVIELASFASSSDSSSSSSSAKNASSPIWICCWINC